MLRVLINFTAFFITGLVRDLRLYGCLLSSLIFVFLFHFLIYISKRDRFLILLIIFELFSVRIYSLDISPLLINTFYELGSESRSRGIERLITKTGYVVKFSPVFFTILKLSLYIIVTLIKNLIESCVCSLRDIKNTFPASMAKIFILSKLGLGLTLFISILLSTFLFIGKRWWWVKFGLEFEIRIRSLEYLIRIKCTIYWSKYWCYALLPRHVRIWIDGSFFPFVW